MQRERDMEAFWRMGMYPIILLVCWFFGIINRNPAAPAHTCGSVLAGPSPALR